MNNYKYLKYFHVLQTLLNTWDIPELSINLKI